MKTSQNAGRKSYNKVFAKAMKIFKLSIYRNIDENIKEKGTNNWRHDQYNEILEVLGHYDNLKSSFWIQYNFRNKRD